MIAFNVLFFFVANTKLEEKVDSFDGSEENLRALCVSCHKKNCNGKPNIKYTYKSCFEIRKFRNRGRNPNHCGGPLMGCTESIVGPN
jgi:hypothetical protein